MRLFPCLYVLATCCTIDPGVAHRGALQVASTTDGAVVSGDTVESPVNHGGKKKKKNTKKLLLSFS